MNVPQVLGIRTLKALELKRRLRPRSLQNHKELAKPQGSKPQVIRIAAPTKSILDTSSEEEDGNASDDGVGEQVEENGITDGSKKVQQKGKRKKDKKIEDPTWQYETVSTGGYPT